MNKTKVLIIAEANPKIDTMYNEWINNGYNAAIMFKKVCKPLRALRRVWMHNNFPFVRIWLADWFDNLNNYDSIILQTSHLTRFLPELISNKYPHLRIICWNWNTIDETNKPIETSNPKIEQWSFDDNDCRKYGFKKNIQYYSLPEKINNQKEYDIYFVGLPKGREKAINEFKEIALNSNLTCNFNIVNGNSYIPYIKVKEDLAKSRAVLEINKDNQIGFTLRTLESLFFGIKLITNNANIKNSPIYNKNNVFIIGEDNYEELYSFIYSEYDHSVDYLKEKYDVNTWFNNFYQI